MSVLINNLQEGFEVNQDILEIIEDVVNQVLKVEEGEDKEVSIALVDDDYIKQLNSKYREHDQTTDVLSFPQDDDFLLGDIIISLDTAQAQAQEYNHSLAREIGFLTVHGMLHLFGYGHYKEQERRIMRKKEEEILLDLGLSRE